MHIGMKIMFGNFLGINTSNKSYTLKVPRHRWSSSFQNRFDPKKRLIGLASRAS